MVTVEPKATRSRGMLDEIDQGEFAHAGLELAQACVDEDLALLGHVVFGVFAQIAERSRLLDLSGKLVLKLVFELFDLFQQFFLDVFGHGTSIAAKNYAGRSHKGWGANSLQTSIIQGRSAAPRPAAA